MSTAKDEKTRGDFEHVGGTVKGTTQKPGETSTQYEGMKTVIKGKK